MGKVKQMKVRNRAYYFFNDMISFKEFESDLLEIDKKHYKAIDIYYIGYMTIKKINDCENIYSINLLYWLINNASGYIKEKNENKYFFVILLMKTKSY